MLNTARIAKNTIFLYLRMVLVLAANFLAVRVLTPTYLFPEREIRVTLKGVPDDLSGLEPAQRKLLGLDTDSYGRVNGRVNLGRATPLYDAICQHPGLRQGKLRELTGLSDRTIRRYLAEDLINFVQFRGAPKTGGYYPVGPAT